MFRAIRPSLFAPSVPAIELIKRTVKEVIDDDCVSIAAQLAYYFALALFPALLFVVALASYLPYNVVNDVVAALDPIAPPEVLEIIRKQLESIVAGEAPSVLTIGILGALWSSLKSWTTGWSGISSGLVTFLNFNWCRFGSTSSTRHRSALLIISSISVATLSWQSDWWRR